MALAFKRKLVLAKIQPTAGTDSAPVPATDAMLVRDLEIMTFEGEDLSRGLDYPFMGASPTIPTKAHRKVKFKVELQASGTAGTAPAWGVLMRGCACAQTVNAGTSVVYNPISSAHEMLTLHFNLDGLRFTMIDARGNAKIMLDAQGIPYIEFEFTGLYVAPTDTAFVLPTLTTFQAPDVATTVNTPTFTLGAYSPVLRSFSLDLGNKVEPRFLIRSESIIISDREEACEFQIEAKLLATFNPWALAAARTPVALTMQHGSVAGRRCTLAAPNLQIQRPTGFKSEQGLAETVVRAVPLPGAGGNDQWTLTLT